MENSLEEILSNVISSDLCNLQNVVSCSELIGSKILQVNVVAFIDPSRSVNLVPFSGSVVTLKLGLITVLKTGNIYFASEGMYTIRH